MYLLYLYLIEMPGLPKICVCADHYYDTGNLATGNVSCGTCDITCGNCVSAANLCTTCIDSN